MRSSCWCCWRFRRQHQRVRAEDHLSPEYLAAIDNAILHGSITPPGRATPRHPDRAQGLRGPVQGYPTLTEEQLTTRYFKDGRFRPVTDMLREYHPRADVRIVRDRKWGVPHIYGETDEGGGVRRRLRRGRGPAADHHRS